MRAKELPTRAWAIVGALSFVMVACGARVVPLSQQQVPGEVVAQGDKQPVGVGPTNAIPNALTTVPGQGGSKFVIPGADPACTATKAADKGITKSTIKLGLVASINGPLPGAFNASVEATDSYFNAVNDAGGICGRRVQLLIRDDNGNGQTDLEVATALADDDKVFAFVGSVSAPDDAGIGIVSKSRKIPDIGFPLSFSHSEAPYTYGVPGQLQRRIIGSGATGSDFVNKKYGIKQIAMFWLDESDVSRLEAWSFEAAMQKDSGGKMKICYEQPSTVLDSSFTQYVVNMQASCKAADGPIAVYTTMENNSNIKLALAMRDQGFKPAAYVPTFTSYSPTFISQAQGSTEGAYIAMAQVPFESLQKPQSQWTPGIKELSRYVTTLARYHPKHAEPGSFGAAGWGMADLFTRAAVSCGDELTRKCLLAKLDAMGPFTAGGMLTPTIPREHLIYTPETIVRVQGNRFVPVTPEPPGKLGPPEAPDFWMTSSVLFDWWKYYCDPKHKGEFTHTDQKDSYIKCN